MRGLVLPLVGSAVGGVIAALIIVVISALTSGTVSPLAAGAIGVVFGISAGNVMGRGGGAGRQRLLAAVLRGAVAGLAAAATIFLIQRV